MSERLINAGVLDGLRGPVLTPGSSRCQSRPRILDLFCGAGGASMGYHRAGFEVVGVDHLPQKRYPFYFIQADALEYCAEHGHEYDAIHASPPCQEFSVTKSLWKGREHPDLIIPTRDALSAAGKPYIIENVSGAPLKNVVTLCGSMFGLETKHGSQLRRHRLFEASFWIGLTVPCSHKKDASVIGVYGHGQHRKRRKSPLNFALFTVEAWRYAMGIDWMSRDELAQAVPPAYTEFIGRQLFRVLTFPAPSDASSRLKGRFKWHQTVEC